VKEGVDGGEKWTSVGCQDNIIYVQQKVSNVSTTIENKKGGATVGGGETGCVEKMSETEEPCTSCLLKFIKGLIEAANIVGAG
jgi:hypothetical protein